MAAGVEEKTGQSGNAEAIRENAGEPVGPMPPEKPRDEPAPPIEELRVDGTTQLGMFDAGGKRPGAGTLSLTGGKVTVGDGKGFKKGETIVLEVVAVVREVAQKDKVDKDTGIVTECAQKHVAQITDVRIAETS